MKSYWQKLPAESGTSAAALKQMIKEKRHPVLNSIRMHLVMEIVGWLIFLIVFYDFFEGHQRPLYLNVMIVSSGIFIVTHNLMGYSMARNLETDTDLTQALTNYLTKTKTYSVVSVISRAFSTSTLLLFLTDPIQFTREKYMMLAGLLLLFAVQMGLLIRLWIRRIKRLEASVYELGNA